MQVKKGLNSNSNRNEEIRFEGKTDRSLISGTNKQLYRVHFKPNFKSLADLNETAIELEFISRKLSREVEFARAPAIAVAVIRSWDYS